MHLRVGRMVLTLLFILIIAGCAGLAGKARKAEQANNWQRAIGLYEEALRNNPANKETIAALKKAKNKGYAYFIQNSQNHLSANRYEKAADLSKKALELRPESDNAADLNQRATKAWQDKSLFQIRNALSQRRYLAASHLAETAMKRWPELTEASSLYSAAKKPLEKVEDILEQAAGFEAKAEYESALKAYRRCLILVKDHQKAAAKSQRIENRMKTEMHYAISYAYQQGGKYTKALEQLRSSPAQKDSRQRRKILKTLSELEGQRYFITQLTAQLEGFQGKDEPLKQKLLMEISVDGKTFEGQSDQYGLIALKIPQGDKLEIKSIKVGRKNIKAPFPKFERTLGHTNRPYYAAPPFEIYIPASGRILSRVHYPGTLVEVYEKNGKLAIRNKKPSKRPMPDDLYLRRYADSRVASVIEYVNDTQSWKQKSRDSWKNAKQLLASSRLDGLIPGFQAICYHPDSSANQSRISLLIESLLAEGFEGMAHELALLPVKVFPDQPSKHRWTGKFMEQLNEPSRAAEFYEKAVKKGMEQDDSDEVRKAMLCLAELKRRTGHYDQAIENARKLLETTSEDRPETVQAVVSTLLDSGHKAQAVELLKEEVSKDPMILARSTKNFWLLVDNGYRGKAQNASFKLAKILQHKASNGEYVRWSWVKIAALGPMSQGNPDAAVKIFRNIISKQDKASDRINGLNVLSSFLSQNDEPDLARNVLYESVANARNELGGENDKYARYLLIDALYDAGKYNEAYKVLENAQQKYPDYTRYESIRKRLLAKQDIQQLLGRRISPENLQSIEDYLDSCKKRVDYKALDEMLAKLMNTRPREPEWAVRLARSKLEQAMGQEALNTINSALDRHPQNSELMIIKGKALAKLREYSKAENCLSKTATRDELDPEELALLGRMRSALGDYSGAISAFDLARGKDKNLSVPEYNQVLQHKNAQVKTEKSGSVEVMAEYALLLESAGNLEAAGRTFDKLIKKHKDSIQAKIAYSGYLSRTGRVEKALELLKDALKTTSNEKEKNLLRQAMGAAHSRPVVEKALTEGKGYFWNGQAQKAVNSFKTATELNPNNAEAHYYLGQAYEASGADSAENARRAYQHALALRPGMEIAAQALEDLQNIRSDLRTLSAYPKDHKASVKVARAYMKRGWVKESENLVLSVLEELPENDDALKILFKLYEEWIFHGRSRAKEAIQAAQRRLRANPRSKAAKADLAWAYYRADQTSLGLELVEQLLSGNPDKPRYLNTRANLLTNLGRHTDSISIHKNILAEYPRSSYVWRNLGLAYKKTNQFQKAEDVFRRAFSLNSDEEIYALSLGQSLYMQKQYKKAAKFYKTAKEINPRSLNAREDLAYAFLRLGRPQNALALADEMEQMPDGEIKAAWIRFYEAWQRDDKQKKDALKTRIIDCLQKQMKQYPGEIRPLRNYISGCLRFNYETKEALRLAKKIPSMDVEGYGYDLLLIRARIANGAVKENDAEKLKTMLKDRPWDDNLRQTLACWHRCHGQNAKASNLIRYIVKNEPSYYYEALLDEWTN